MEAIRIIQVSQDVLRKPSRKPSVIRAKAVATASHVAGKLLKTSEVTSLKPVAKAIEASRQNTAIALRS